MKLQTKYLVNILAIALVCLLLNPMNVQTQSGSVDEPKSMRNMLNEIEQSIQRNDIDLITPHFLKQLSLSLPGTESGVYSTNQAISILQNYFNSKHIIAFKFTTIHDRGDILYATGGGRSVSRGKQETFQVYVAFRTVHGSWMISQFNVY
jgi:hypothetical protein